MKGMIVHMGIGKNIKRLDSMEKALGSAKYVEDLIPSNAFVVKILHSTIANGIVKSIDTSDASNLSGVIKIITCFDVPKIPFSTVAHPLSLDPEHQEIEDHLMLTSRIRYYGDDIAAVVAEDEITCKKALRRIKVKYEEYPPLLTCEEAFNTKDIIHDEYLKNNNLASLSYFVKNGELETMNEDEVSTIKDKMLFSYENSEDSFILDDTYKLPMVHHAHIENISSFAYKEGKRIVIVTSTQSPHVIRHIISKAIDYPIGDIRIIKPYVGGGFGNKQEVLYEPLLAYLTSLLGGCCVYLILNREETFINSRVRHAMNIRMITKVSSKEKLSLKRIIKIESNKGSYASHGHAVPGHAVTNAANLYPCDSLLGESYSIHTNLPSSGAMRGYGIPQITFAMESQMDTIASRLNIEPIELRKNLMIKLHDVDPFDKVVKCKSLGLDECIETGKKLIDWDKKREEYKKFTGNCRKGVGMAIFCYKSCVYPYILETASCRIILNQDGSLQIQVGATEIGQGSDTCFAQMAAEVLKISEEKINVISTQDTDITPYDPGSYASRQSYVTGRAVKKASEILKSKIIKHASKMSSIPESDLDLYDENVIINSTKNILYSIGEISSHSLYNKEHSQHLTSEVTITCNDNAFSTGACFVDIDVDIALSKIKINSIVSVHDSGQIINPKLGEAQIHGGVAMAVGYAMSEEMLFHPKTGKPLNNNFLDYKIPTSMDIPEIKTEFVMTNEPSGPFGNKGLGEPPIIPPAPAIRNALYHATGVMVNELPLTPQRLFEHFVKSGLIEKVNLEEV